MAFWDRNKPERTASDDEIRPPRARQGGSGDAFGGVNSRTKKRQGVLLATVGGLVLVGGSFYIFSGDDK